MKETYLPELLRCILASHALQDLRAARVFVDELGHVVDIAVDDDVQALLGAGVGGDVGRGECLRHFVHRVQRGGVCVRMRVWSESGDRMGRRCSDVKKRGSLGRRGRG